MSNFAILRNGELVKQLIFFGEGLYKDKKIEVVTFEREDQAKELLSIWPDAQLVPYEVEQRLAA